MAGPIPINAIGPCPCPARRSDTAAFCEMLKEAPDQPAVRRENLLEAALHDVAQWRHLLTLSAEDTDIAVVLRWWGTKELDWFWLKIYEIIENNVARPNQSALLASLLGCDRSAIQSFLETACHPGKERGGDKARHSVPIRKDPLHEPMSLANARYLIAHLIRQWLTYKSQQHT